MTQTTIQMPLTYKRTPSFRQQFQTLPLRIRTQTYELLRDLRLSRHPPFGFPLKNLRGDVYAATIGAHIRLLGKRIKDDEIVWFWIGTHAEYDELIN